MENSIKPLVLLILTQGMIFLGEVPNPMTGKKETNLQAAEPYLRMMKVLYEKTRGNLDESEELFLRETLENLKLVFQKKVEK